MATVSLSSITNSLPIFIRDVLRENLTDTQSPARTGSNWIFKGKTMEDYDPPMVIINRIDYDGISLNMEGSKRRSLDIDMEIFIWADGMKDRDDVADEIREVLTDNSNTDGTNSIKSQYLIARGISITNTAIELMWNKPLGLKRQARLVISWRYRGS